MHCMITSRDLRTLKFLFKLDHQSSWSHSILLYCAAVGSVMNMSVIDDDCSPSTMILMGLYFLSTWFGAASVKSHPRFSKRTTVRGFSCRGRSTSCGSVSELKKTLTWKNHLENSNTNLFGHISVQSVMASSWGEWLSDGLSLHKCQGAAGLRPCVSPSQGCFPRVLLSKLVQGCCSADTHAIKACIIRGRPCDCTRTRAMGPMWQRFHSHPRERLYTPTGRVPLLNIPSFLWLLPLCRRATELSGDVRPLLVFQIATET